METTRKIITRLTNDASRKQLRDADVLAILRGQELELTRVEWE